MSELLQSGQHPDADQLSAFVERALPPHEQKETLAHLAVCADCRAIVSLSMPAVEEHLQPKPLTMRRPWFAWYLGLPVAAAFAALVLIVIHIRSEHAVSDGSATPAQIAESRVPEPLRSRAVAAPPAPQPPRNLEPSPIKSAKPQAAVPEAIPARVTQLNGPLSLNVEVGRSPVSQPVGVAGAIAGMAGGTAGIAGGGIQGVVIDPSGARVRDAQVIATNTSTGVQTVRRSNEQGVYSIQPLQPGPYSVEVVAKGFERLLQENVAVNDASVVGLNPRLTVGGQNETVTVTDAPATLATTDAAVGGTVENEAYSQLPLSMNGVARDSTAFQYVMPGAQANANGTGLGSGTGAGNLKENPAGGTAVAAARPTAAPAPPPPLPRQATGVQMATSAGAAPTLASQNGDLETAMDQASVASQVKVGGAAMVATGTSAAVRTRSVARPLPSGLAILSAVAEGHRMLAIDTGHALFLSDDDGQHWKPVGSQWQGRAVKVDLIEQVPTVRGAISGEAMAPLTAADAGSGLAETTRGADSSLAGVVSDSSGAAISKATVSVVELTTAAIRTVRTDPAGHYLVGNLAPGGYRIEAFAPGFQHLQRTLTLAASQQASANLVLQVGAADETVTVTSASPQLRETSHGKARMTPAPAVFEITTDSGEHWVSRDGQTWKLK